LFKIIIITNGPSVLICNQVVQRPKKLKVYTQQIWTIHGGCPNIDQIIVKRKPGNTGHPFVIDLLMSGNTVSTSPLDDSGLCTKLIGNGYSQVYWARRVVCPEHSPGTSRCRNLLRSRRGSCEVERIRKIPPYKPSRIDIIREREGERERERERERRVREREREEEGTERERVRHIAVLFECRVL
jgi:hypothetical protein